MRATRLWAAAFILLGLGVLCSPVALAGPPINLEVIVEQGAPLTAQQQWLQRLSELKLAGVTIRNAREGEAVEIINRGTAENPRYKIVAILSAKEKLVLPGGQFGPGDMGRLRQFLETLNVQGVEGVTKPKEAFGLTSEQLIALTKDLEAVVDFETKGEAPLDVIAKIVPQLTYPVNATTSAERALKSAAPCRDEVKGLTSGTALAILLRPYGLVLQPKLVGKNLELHVVVPGEDTEAWPVGWPIQGTDKEAIPALMEFINVEIQGIAMPDALAALQERLAVPFLFDHNQLAKHGIDPAKLEVTVPTGRSYYKRILERVLFPARLKSEVRTDELGKPMIWITTIKE